MKHFYRLFCIVFIFSGAPLHAETIAGRVVGPDGAPVAAQVFFVPNSGQRKHQQMQTEADGKWQFEIEAPPAADEATKIPGSVRAKDAVAAYAPGFALSIAPQASEGETVVKLTPSYRVSDVLRDEKGAPVAGANIEVSFVVQRIGDLDESEMVFFMMPDALKKAFTTQSGADGTWQISDVSAQGSTHVQLDDNDYVPSSAQFDVGRDENGPSNGKLIARRAGRISGRVLDEKGTPAADVTIVVVPQTKEKNARDTGGRAITLADGTFLMPRVLPGTYALLVQNYHTAYRAKDSGEPKLYAAPAIEGVTVRAGETAADFKLQLVQPALLKGRILDRATGKPMKRAIVGAYGRGAPRALGLLTLDLSDDEGRFALALVPGANALYAYEASSFGNEKPTDIEAIGITLPAGVKAQSLWINRRFADVSGQVVDEAGQPVSDTEITLWNNRGTGKTLHSDEKGNFLVEGNQKGNLRLETRGEWSVVKPKTIAVRSDNERVTIVLHRNALAKVTGRVVDNAGHPVAGAKLRFTMPYRGGESDNARSILSVKTDDEGNYVFKALKLPEALELKRENASKDGYKFVEGGALPAGVTPTTTEIALSDVIMNRLDRKLAGIVVDSDGAPVAGALLRASGDNYQNLTTSDARGQFVLTQQEAGELRLLAAQGRAFASTRLPDGDTGDARIPLGAPAVTPPQDVEGAIALFHEILPTLSPHDLEKVIETLAPLDPQAALQLALEANNAKADFARLNIINQLKSDSSAEVLQWAKDEAAHIEDDALFIEAHAKIGLLLAQTQPDEAAQLLPTITARADKLEGQESAVATAWQAALATRLKLPQAETLLESALQGVAQKRQSIAPLIAPLSSASAELATQVLATLSREPAITIDRYRTAIETVARYDASGALPLLETMRELVDALPDLPTVNGHYEGRNAKEFDWAFAAKAVLRHLDRSEFETAAKIARRVQLWHRTSALALAAEFGTPAQQMAMAQETVAADDRGGWMKNVTLPRLAALVAPLNAELAAQWLAETDTALAKQQRENDYGSYADWSFYAAFWQPARARLALEAEWQIKEQKTPLTDEFNNDAWRRSSLAMAMSSLDVERAIEMANQLSDQTSPNNSSPRAHALAFIGRFFLTPPNERRLLVVGVESGYDS